MSSRPVAPVPPKTAMRIGSSSSSDDGSGGRDSSGIVALWGPDPTTSPDRAPGTPTFGRYLRVARTDLDQKSSEMAGVGAAAPPPRPGETDALASASRGAVSVPEERSAYPRSGQRPRRRPPDDRIDS